MDDLTDTEFKKWIQCSRKLSLDFTNPGSCTPLLLLNSHVCSFVFELCNQLKTPREVTFKALEYFGLVLSMRLPPEIHSSGQNHAELYLKTANKSKLCLISTLQIATKLVYRHKVLKTMEAERLLKKLLCDFQRREILNEELRTLNILQSQLNDKTLGDCFYFVTELLQKHLNITTFCYESETLLLAYCTAPYMMQRFNVIGRNFLCSFDFKLLLGCAAALSTVVLCGSNTNLPSAISTVSKITRIEFCDLLRSTYLLLSLF